MGLVSVDSDTCSTDPRDVWDSGAAMQAERQSWMERNDSRDLSVHT